MMWKDKISLNCHSTEDPSDFAWCRCSPLTILLSSPSSFFFFPSISYCFLLTDLQFHNWRNAAQSPVTPHGSVLPSLSQLPHSSKGQLGFNFSFHLKCKLFTFLTVQKWLHSYRPENKLFYPKKSVLNSMWQTTLESIWRYSILAHRGTHSMHTETPCEGAYRIWVLLSGHWGLQHFWKSVGAQGFWEHCSPSPKAQLRRFPGIYFVEMPHTSTNKQIDFYFNEISNCFLQL